MTLSTAIKTAALPGINEKSFYIAPKTSDGEIATSNFQTLHFTAESIQRSQNLNDDPEYGGSNDFIDASDPIAGDITASGTLSTRLCLSETSALLGYALGAGEVTAGAGFSHVHTFQSGKSELPILDAILEAAGGRKTIDKTVIGGFSMAFGRAAEYQKVDFRVTSRDADFAPAPALEGAAEGYERDLVTKAGWEVLINDAPVGRLLSSSLDYNSDIQEDRYLNSNLTADEFYLGNPTLTGTHRIRYDTPEGLDVYSPDTPHKVEFRGTAASGRRISLIIPRAFATRPAPKQDGTLLDYDVTWRAAKVETGTPAPMMTVTVNNEIASY